jgi:hypothetical protein
MFASSNCGMTALLPVSGPASAANPEFSRFFLLFLQKSLFQLA